jgi:hypothetical protein
MLSSRLIQLVADHWKEITDRVVHEVERDGRLLEMMRLPEPELRARSRDILLNLDRWLVSSKEEVSRHYEELGRRRCEEGIPLHEMVYALQAIKRNMIQYVRDQGISYTPLDIYAEEELEHGAETIFDWMIYYVVRGYERGLGAGKVMTA